MRKRAPRQNAKPKHRGKTGGRGDLALRGNAGKPCGPKRSADGRGAGRAARRNKKRLGRP